MNIWLYLGLLVFIILIIKNIRKDTFSQDSLYTPKEWGNYRLGDVVNGPGRLGGDISYHSKKYPGSLADMYLKFTSEPRNYKGFANIIKQWIKKNIRSKKTVYNSTALHLRVGDIMERNNPKDVSYYKPPEYYKTLKIPTEKVTIFAGIHKHGTNSQKSMKYIEDIGQILEKRGYKVKYTLGGSPDESFVSMVMATHYIEGGGGYSQLVTSTRRYM